MSADDSHMLTRAREVTAEEYAAQVGLARGALSVAPVALKARETRTAPVRNLLTAMGLRCDALVSSTT
jgi:hypothetical protein